MNVRNKIIAMSAVAGLLGASVAHAAVTVRATTNEAVETVAPRVAPQVSSAQARVKAALDSAGVNVIQLNTNSSLVNALTSSDASVSQAAEKILTALKDPAQTANVKFMLERGQTVSQIASSLESYAAVNDNMVVDAHAVEIMAKDDVAGKNLRAILTQAETTANAAHPVNMVQAEEFFVQALGPATKAVLGTDRTCEVFGKGRNPSCAADGGTCEVCNGLIKPKLEMMASQMFCNANDNTPKSAAN